MPQQPRHRGNFLAVSEGLVIGKRYGLDPQAMVDMLDVSTGMSWISKTHIRQRVMSALAQQLWRAAAMYREPDASVSELARWVEQLNGTEIHAGGAASPVDAGPSG